MTDEEKLSSLAHGIQLSGELMLRALHIGDLDASAALLEQTYEELKRAGQEQYLMPRPADHHRSVMAPRPGLALGPSGLTVGVLTDSGRGRLIATAAMELKGNTSPIDTIDLANVHLPREKVAYMRTLAVAPSHRRLGLAQAMLKARVKATRNIGRISYGTVEVSNIASQRLFRSLGFFTADIGEQLCAYGGWFLCLVDQQAPEKSFALKTSSPVCILDPAKDTSICIKRLRCGHVGQSTRGGRLKIFRLKDKD